MRKRLKLKSMKMVKRFQFRNLECQLLSLELLEKDLKNMWNTTVDGWLLVPLKMTCLKSKLMVFRKVINISSE